VFAAGPQTAIGYMKANVRDAATMSLTHAIAVESQRMVASSQTDDHREAGRAWMEKRNPHFGRH